MSESTGRILGLAVLVAGALVAGVRSDPSRAQDRAAEAAPDIRYVVLHRPGPAWQRGVDPREQPGVGAHVAHYRLLQEQGKLDLGGPFLGPEGGGMMVPAAGVAEAEIRAFAAADPAVAAGLLEFEVRPWYVAMKRGS